MKNYNRRERRKLAKMLGLRTSNESYKTWLERTFRSIQAGNQIARQTLANTENDTRQQLVDIAAHAAKHLSEGVPLRYSKRELIKAAHRDEKGKYVPSEYTERVPIVFSPGHGEAEAKRIMEENYRVAEERSDRLRARRKRQLQANAGDKKQATA